MTDFVLQQYQIWENNDDATSLDLVILLHKYAEFLKQPLTIEMFEPGILFKTSPTHDPGHHIRSFRTVEYFAGLGYELTEIALKKIYE